MPTEGEELNSGLVMLQNRYREMEAEMKLAQDDSVQTLKLQRSKINKLRSDNSRLKSDLQLETIQAKGSLHKTGSTTISALQSEGDFYQKKYLLEKQTIEHLDKEIDELQKHILMQRSEMGGVNATRESGRKVEKDIRMYENKLDKANVKYNEALGHNKKLRETIDNLRRDRAVFDGIYNKLQSDLEQKKEQMGKIMDEAMHAYEARVQAQVELVKLREQGDKETQQFEKEWAQLNRMIEECQRKSREQKNNKAKNGNNVIDDVVEEERELKRKLEKSTFQVINDKIAIDKATEEVKYYREAFERIKSATGISDIDELVENFEAADKENFALFNEANNLNKDIERLEGHIADMRQQIEKAQSTGFNADTQRKKILDELQRRMDATEAKIKVYDEKHQTCMATVDSLKEGIADILKCMNAEKSDPDVMTRLDSVGINESNLMEYLAVIENRTNQLIEQYLSNDGARAETFVSPTEIDTSLAMDATMGVGVGTLEDDLMIVAPTTLTEFPEEEEEVEN